MGDQVSKETYIELLKRYAAIKADRDRMGKALEHYGPRLRKWQFGSVNESRNALADLRSDAGKRAMEALGDEH